MPEALKLFDKFKKWTITNKYLLLILLCYFIFNLINLTLLPIFNDEAIYIDWGWIQTHWPGKEYDSLSDAKQPLMIWLFGIFSNFFSDPLYAGRFVSVLFGAGSLIGIYLVSKKLFNKNTGLIATFTFSVTPIFVFFNRQALLESGLVCVGVWAFYFLMSFLEKPVNKNAILLGVILGIGFFIKSTTLIFIFTAFLIMLIFVFKHKKYDYLKPISIILASIIAVDALLFINPVFWQTLSSNSRYSFTFMELAGLPIKVWVNNFLGFMEIGFFSITPLVFVSGIVGLYLIFKNKIKNFKIFFIYFLGTLFLEIFLNKSQSSRYLVPFLPFLIISSSYVFYILWRKNSINKLIVGICLVIPLISSLFLVINPKNHILNISKLTKYSELIYLSGQTSGVGVNEAVNHIKDNVNSRVGIVVFGLNAGNPESAINAYANKTDNLLTFRMDSRLYPGIEAYQCMTSKYPLFFVTRNGELLGMEKFFYLAKSIPASDNYSIKIYQLKEKCRGKSISFDDLYKDTITEVLMIKPQVRY